MGEAKRRKQSDPNFGKVRYFQRQKLLPDLGEYYLQNQEFNLFCFQENKTHLYQVAKDPKLGYIIIGSTSALSTAQGFNLKPFSSLPSQMFFTISLGFLRKEAVLSLLEKFKSEGLEIRIIPKERYQAKTREWVTPFECLTTAEIKREIISTSEVFTIDELKAQLHSLLDSDNPEPLSLEVEQLISIGERLYKRGGHSLMDEVYRSIPKKAQMALEIYWQNVCGYMPPNIRVALQGNRIKQIERNMGE